MPRPHNIPLQLMPSSSTSSLSSYFCGTPREEDPDSVLLIKETKNKKRKNISVDLCLGTAAPKKRKINKNNTSCPSPKYFSKPEPAELPIRLKNKIRVMGGDNVKFIVQKYVRATDLSGNNNRLLIPVDRVASPDFLRGGEKVKVRKRVENNDKRIEGMPVLGIDQSGAFGMTNSKNDKQCSHSKIM